MMLCPQPLRILSPSSSQEVCLSLSCSELLDVVSSTVVKLGGDNTASGSRYMSNSRPPKAYLPRRPLPFF